MQELSSWVKGLYIVRTDDTEIMKVIDVLIGDPGASEKVRFYIVSALTGEMNLFSESWLCDEFVFFRTEAEAKAYAEKNAK